ncbi:GntR family transcriptional regulator [Paraburkholderia unamae]|uniref:GntR family transcriptional regulator n=1 Tax=Paraburkholderia unamae TaxID=219649 RepID=A0ABX5KEW6_9BURK|nr:GntR family transcriptional regulator [Paraburkholderia unamae]PVX72503.1 GntR family transcriptional regulator [Paraburkholderia unamae]RAR53577.1 GntR family transcriptional regulator [Paraburkholderia unamae]CAG9250955.1 GntR family transcriptional regulator [Paraburkholderia unamae]
MNGPNPLPSPDASAEQTLADQAYSQIEERIATLSLRPGQIVSENGLSKLLGLGRTPVREALQQLSREGLVVIMPKLGIMVSEIDVRKQLRLLEVRREVERLLVGAAAKNATPAQRTQFGLLADLMTTAGKANEGVEFLAYDRQFNKLLLDSANNEYGTSTMKLMYGLSRRFWYAHYQRFANLAQTASLHADIATAIAAGNVEAARDGLDNLIDNVEMFTRATLEA